MIFDDLMAHAASPLTTKAFSSFAATVRDAHKIIVPSEIIGNRELRATALAFARDGAIIPPFTTVAIATTMLVSRVGRGSKEERAVVLACMNQSFVYVEACVVYGDGVVSYRPLGLRVRWDRTVDGMAVFRRPDSGDFVEVTPGSDDARIFEARAPLFMEAFRVAAVACVAVGAKGVETERVEPSPALQRARMKRGKPPLLDYHIIKIGGVSHTGRVLGVGCKHASPRTHWRRGHVRVYHRGEPNEKKVVIPPVLVNEGAAGFVNKVYKIDPGAVKSIVLVDGAST